MNILLNNKPEILFEGSTIKKLLENKNIKINKVVGVNEHKTSEIKKSNLEIKNFFSKLGIFLIS